MPWKPDGNSIALGPNECGDCCNLVCFLPMGFFLDVMSAVRPLPRLGLLHLPLRISSPCSWLVTGEIKGPACLLPMG